jgi:sortase (surface protein transpeptidase)
MKNKKILTVSLITFISIAVFLFTLVRSVFYFQNNEINLPNQIISKNYFGISSKDLPKKFLIPSIKVDANVQYVGVTYKGNVSTPNNFNDVGWYKYGTVPGQVGSAIIDGHVDNGLSLPGVFKDLKNVKEGDDVYVVTQTGKNAHFVVTDVSTYYYKSVPTEIIFNQKDAPMLKIITCDGNWVPEDQTDDHRIVVSAILSD